MGTWNYKIIFDYNATQLIADFRRENASLRQAKGTANEDIDFLIYAEKSDHRFSVGKVLLIKMSDGMVQFYKDYNKDKEDKEEKEYKTDLLKMWSSYIVEQNKDKKDFQFTEDDIKYAFETALLMQFKIEGIDLSMVFGFIVEHIDKFYNNFLEKNLLTREEWDPTLKSKKYKFDRHTKFFDIQIKVCNKIIQELRTLHGKLKPYSKYNFKPLDALLKVINFFIKGITAYRDIMTKSKEALQASIAYLCGLWNGIINFIAGLIDLVLLVIKIGIGGVLDVNNLEATALLEGIEEIVNHIEAELETNPNAIEDGIKAALANYKESRYSDPNLNKYQIAYHAGEDTILAISLFLAIGAILKIIASITRQIFRFTAWLDGVLARNGKGALSLEEALQEAQRSKKLIGVIEYEILSENLLKKYIDDILLLCKEKGIKLEIKWIDKTHPEFNSDLLGRLEVTMDKKKLLMHVRPECPKITWYHEKKHLDDFLEMGWKRYTDISKKTPWLHEESVWNHLYKYRNKWSEPELVDAYLYYQNYIRKKSLYKLDFYMKEMEELGIKHGLIKK